MITSERGHGWYPLECNESDSLTTTRDGSQHSGTESRSARIQLLTAIPAGGATASFQLSVFFRTYTLQFHFFGRSHHPEEDDLNRTHIRETMKLKILSAGTCLALLATFVIAGCQGKSEETASEDPVAEKTEAYFLVAGHPVTDFDAWKAGYEAGDSLREANGLSHIGLFRVDEDSNYVWVMLAAVSLEGAHAFTESDELKQGMEEAGVAGEPRMIFMRQLRDTGLGEDTANRLLISHSVADVEAWTEVFDAHAPARSEAGLIDMGIMEDTETEGMIYLMFGVTDADAARAFMASDDLKTAMETAGVTGEPVISWVHVAD